MVLLPGCNSNAAAKLSERLRKAVEAASFLCEGQELDVTVSIGCDVRNPESDLATEAMVNRADKALYESKANGRNRVTMAS